MSEIKVVVFGVGDVGSGIIRTLQNRKGVKVIGAVDVHKDKVGKDAGEVAGCGNIGITIAETAEEVLSSVMVDVVINTASPVGTEATFDQIRPFMEKGADVLVASAETCNLRFTDDALAEKIDQFAKKHGVSYMGIGATQVEERFIISMTEGSTDVKNISFTHHADVQAFSDESNAAEWGISLQEEDYYKGIEAGTVKSKEELKASIPYLADAFGWEIDEVKLDKKPLVNETGRIYALHATVTGYIKGEPKLTMTYEMEEDPEKNYYDHLVVEGTPMIDCMANYTPDRGMASTIGALSNAIPFIYSAAPGYHNTLKAPACGITFGDYTKK